MIPFLPIEQHGVIGDRRTAALVAADGTLNWLCLPRYDAPSVFGALLDTARGGFWRIGPAANITGQQRYHDESATLVTTWHTTSGALELSDVMAWPAHERPSGQEQRRVVLRRLRCLEGEITATMRIRPRDDFDRAPQVLEVPGGISFDLERLRLGLWTSFPLTLDAEGATAELAMRADDEVWAVLDLDMPPDAWSVAAAQHVFDAAHGYWHDWQHSLTYTGPRRKQVLRSALLVHLLSYGPTGALVAAPTTSLPERLGGRLNYDYRYAWVRDASLSMALISLVGDTATAQHFIEWLTGLGSTTDAPLQVMYSIDGNTNLEQRERDDLAGYRGSPPVRFGNRAYQQRQLDSLGFLGECALVYLEHAGEWHPSYWELLKRAADYTAANWHQPDSGIWELPQQAHYVSSKVMSWCMLKRTVQVAHKLGRDDETDSWSAAMDAIMAEVMERGWSDKLQSFRQRYDTETLDASALLIAVMNMLPADHPRVLATVKQVEAQLTIDGFVHRFAEDHRDGQDGLPLGAHEGAFLPCTFWLATTYAKQGRTADADAILRGAEAIAGELGLFAEEVDARGKTFLGNYPLVFSQVEYIQSVVELAKAVPLDAARYYLGASKIQASRLVHGRVRRPDDAER